MEKHVDNMTSALLNDTCWAFIEAYPTAIHEQVSGNLFNNLKGLMALTLDVYEELKAKGETK